MSKQPKLSFWQIWNMSFGFLGIQFGFALQNANVSRIFETLGAGVDKLAIYWIAAPLTGLIVQPIIGHYSDNTWTKLGRRRPYFLVGAILATIALFIMPNSAVLWIAIGMLWIMDASINISMEPFRAFVGDMLPSEQRTKGFAMQSFFIGTGAVVASMLPYMLANWFGVANSAPEGEIADTVKWSFYIGGAVFFLAVLWTVIKSKEYSPEELKSFQNDDNSENSGLESDEEYKKNTGEYKNGLLFLSIGLVATLILFYVNVEKEVYLLSIGLMAFGLFEIVAGWMKKNNFINGLVKIVSDFNTMPSTMKQLAWVQFFSWFALFAMWIYTTSSVTRSIFGTSDTSSELYNEGANWVGNCFAVYNGFAAVFAFLLMYLARKTSRKFTHLISLIVGGVSLISIYFIQDKYMLLIPFVGIGLAWASILAMPYAILTGSLPINKMGVYMGIFNFFIVIPQILAASILGFVIQYVFKGEPVYALVLGGVSMFIAAGLVLLVKDNN